MLVVIHHNGHCAPYGSGCLFAEFMCITQQDVRRGIYFHDVELAAIWQTSHSCDNPLSEVAKTTCGPPPCSAWAGLRSHGPSQNSKTGGIPSSSPLEVFWFFTRNFPNTPTNDAFSTLFAQKNLARPHPYTAELNTLVQQHRTF